MPEWSGEIETNGVDKSHLGSGEENDRRNNLLQQTGTTVADNAQHKQDIFKRGNNKRINPDGGTSDRKLRWSGGVTGPFPELLYKT